MEKDSLIHSIERLLISMHKQIVDVRDTDGKVPKPQMDKILADVRALYEQFTVLNYLNTYGSETDKQTVQALKNKIEAAQEITEEIPEPIKPEPVITPVVETHFTPIIEKEVFQEPEKVEEPQPETIPEIKPATSSPVTRNDAAEIKSTLADKNENKDITLADKLRMQKVDDLHKVVSMADKFLFMNDLFKGELSAYKEAVDMLNRLESGDEAERFLTAMSVQYQWTENPKTEKKFKELVARKFA